VVKIEDTKGAIRIRKAKKHDHTMEKKNKQKTTKGQNIIYKTQKTKD